MIVIAYDDNAVITGPNGEAHKGVFTLRNSWDSYAGNNGDYYMSYDYLKDLTFEAIEIAPKERARNNFDI